MLSAQKHQARPVSVAARDIESSPALHRSWRCRLPAERPDPPERLPLFFEPNREIPVSQDCVAEQRAACTPELQDVDPLYLFACHVEWNQREDPSAAWELISAAQSENTETRAHAKALLAASRHIGGSGSACLEYAAPRKRVDTPETEMTSPYDLEIVDNCADCPNATAAHFCRLSAPVLQAFNEVSHKSVLPAGAILFVEGQVPRGMFLVCSGSVNLSTTSRDGKSLMLKTAEAGEALGLGATISGLGYEVTAETATPCLLSFVDRKHYLELMEAHGELGMHTALCLSRECRTAHRDIHDLILTRSSAGKLARLLLAELPQSEEKANERNRFFMTHEEIALRIGSSRETVTRLLGRLRRKRLIGLDGPRLIIRDREGLKSLAS